MKRYISTLWLNTDQSISARIIISYYSQTRRQSQRVYDTVTVRVGNSVIQISNVPLVELRRTLRVMLIALVLLPYYIAHAARLNPDRERLSDSLRKVVISWKTTNLMRKLNKKSILSLTEESATSMVSVFACKVLLPHACAS